MPAVIMVRPFGNTIGSSNSRNQDNETNASENAQRRPSMVNSQ
jgi:hypothetical protein